MRQKNLLRKGLPDDSEHFSNLILHSAGSVLPAFGLNASVILKSLFINKSNLFSFQHCHFVLSDNNIAGMVLSYSYQAERKERFKTGLLLFKCMKFNLLRRLHILSRVNAVFGELKTGAFYISNIAVYPEYRGNSLAKELLKQVEVEAKEAGAKRLVLDVEADKREAINLYLKTGFTSTKETKSITIYDKPHHFYRMFKNLST
ncbi:GNAT family N-acetyltransferase [Chloroflexota bacterium]